MQGVRLTASHTRSAEIRRLPRLHDAVQRFPILNSRFKHSIKSFVLALAAITIAAVLPLRHSCFAQSNILGTSAFDGGTFGYSISQVGESIVVSPVGYIASDGGTGHLIGRFTKSSEKELLKVTRVSDDTFAFSTVDSAGAESSNTIKLSRAVGNRYYLLTGFRLPKQRSDSVALVDISNDRYYWFIIENPAQSTIRERKSFYLGFQGDRIEHSLTNRRGLEFAAIRQTMNTSRTRIQLRSSSTGQTRVVRFRWTDPDGILIPTRLSLQSRRDIGLGLYSPAKKTLIIPSSRGEIKQLEVPALRCDGYQAITSVNSQGNISALELCPSGEFFLSERGNNASSEDRIVSSGPLPAPLNGARRADQTLVMTDTGEAPVQIPAAGSNGSELLAPAPGAPTPVRNSWPTPTALPTVLPADTPTFTATATETPTETATYTATPGDTSAPVPGSFGTPSAISANGYTLNWGAATDDTSSSADLEYRVCSGSGSTEVDTIAECESATTELHYTANITTLLISGQAPGATRVYNVIVRDLAGNKSLYEGLTQSTNRWKALSTTSAPLARRMHTGAWTGNTNSSSTQNRLIIWGGTTSSSFECTNTGGIYNPATDSWQPTSSTGAPTARRWLNNFPIWTGATGHPSTEHRMIVWGGVSSAGASLGSGGIYNPADDSWTPMSTVQETPRDQFTAVWTGATGDPDTKDRMIIWGATSAQPSIYDMRNNTWTTGTSTGAPSSRTYATAVWTGATGNAATENRMIVWGGWPVTNAGGIYNPKTNTWTAMTTVGAPSERRWHTATWIGSKMVVYGGINGSNAFQNNGGIYDPLTDTWTTIPTSTGFGMQSMVSFWTGSTVGLVHWNEIRFLDPSTLTWTTYPNMNGVKGLVRYGAGFWTGSNFIMWGGEGILGEGSIFYP